MAKIKKDTNEAAAKRLGLFDHISAVTEYQDPQYWTSYDDQFLIFANLFP